MTDRAATFRRAVRTVLCTPPKHLLNLIAPPAVVLLYHRVTTLPSDPELLAVTPDNFREQMRHLMSHCSLVRFEDEWTQTAKPAVAITFDDGYADNLLEALPILEELAIPATFFITTGSIGGTQEFWWHELERIFLGGSPLPARITLEDERNSRSWDTGTQEERNECYHGLVRLMNDSSPQVRERLLSQLRSWSADLPANGRNRALTVAELQLLAGSRLVTIGAHTVTHSRLSSLPPAAQREEIITSKRQLETWLDREVTTFSYPFGRRSDYTMESMNICREAGFAKAAANFPGQMRRWTDPYQIPRHLVRNWPVEQFAGKLREFRTR